VKRGTTVYLSIAPPLCAPCRSDQHADCSFDGEPECLCKTCPAKHKAANRRRLDKALTAPRHTTHPDGSPE
jgi:hypothetical protein